jgi:hypothetical protein
MLSRMPLFVFVFLCVIASVFGAFVSLCIAALIKSWVGMTGDGFVLAFLALLILGLVLPVVFLVRARTRANAAASPGLVNASSVDLTRTTAKSAEQAPLHTEKENIEAAHDQGRAQESAGTAALATFKRPVAYRFNWNWIALVATLGGFWAIYVYSTNVSSLDLELRTENAGNLGSHLTIVNVGEKPITMTAVSINGRDECAKSTLFGPALVNLPRELKVGDRITHLSSCIVVRVTLETDRGAAIYTFK